MVALHVLHQNHQSLGLLACALGRLHVFGLSDVFELLACLWAVGMCLGCRHVLMIEGIYAVGRMLHGVQADEHAHLNPCSLLPYYATQRHRIHCAATASPARLQVQAHSSWREL
eukprot:207915-Chlamydomonas_euryale.AAC.5